MVACSVYRVLSVVLLFFAAAAVPGGVSPSPSSDVDNVAAAEGRRATGFFPEFGEAANNSTAVGEDHEPSKEGSVTVAVMVLSCVGLGLGILYLVNHNHDDIQQAAWHMLKDIVVIFVAVMWYQVMDTILDAKIPPQPGNDRRRLLFALLLWTTCYLAMQLISFQLARCDKNWSMTCTFFGAPVCGLVGKEVGSSLLYLEILRGNAKLSLVAAVMTALGFISVVWTMNTIRWYCINGIQEAAMRVKADACEVLVCHAENVMSSVAVSFVFMQAISHVILGYLPSADMDTFRHMQSQRFEMLGCSVICSLLSFSLVKLRLTRGVGTFIDDRVRRVADCMQTTSTMLMAWCILYWGYWEICETHFSDYKNSGFVILSVTASAFSGVSIVLLDWIASHRAGLARTSVLKCAFSGFALLVAFAWEQTFDYALEDISQVALGLKPATSKIIAASVVMALTLPAFTWYILPKTVDQDPGSLGGSSCKAPPREEIFSVGFGNRQAHPQDGQPESKGPVIVTAFAV